MFKDLEIGITRDNQLIYDYKRLDKLQQVKLYNIAVLGLALMDLDKLGKGILDLSGWHIFGLNAWWIIIPLSIMVAGTFLSSLASNGEFTVDIVLKELWWLLLMLLPGIVGILFGLSNFKIYI